MKKLVDALDRACRSLGFRDYMPLPMIGHFTKQIVPASFKDDKLDLDQFYKWVRQEYSVPDHVFGRIFSRLKEEADEVGVEIVLPLDYAPGFNDTLRTWLKSELKDVVYAELKEEMRDEVKSELKVELRPEVHQNLRHMIEKSGADFKEMDDSILRSMGDEDHQVPEAIPADEVSDTAEVPDAEPAPACADVPEAAPAPPAREPRSPEEIEDELRRLLRGKVEAELKASLTESISNEIQSRLKSELAEKVREELRNELWEPMREEVKEDLRTMLSPVLEKELRTEMAGLEGSSGAPFAYGMASDECEEITHGPEDFPEPPPEEQQAAEPRAQVYLTADDQLRIIKQVRERLIPAIRDQVIGEIRAVQDAMSEEEKKQRIGQCLSDSDYCLDKIRGFLFPDQPRLWERVKRFIDPAQWQIIVVALEEGVRQDELERTRAVIRETLKLKAEIGEEMEAAYEEGSGELNSEEQAIRVMLAGTDEVLDYALQSIAGLLSEEAGLRH